MRSSVLLPQPEGPRMVTKSFSATCRSVACSASVGAPCAGRGSCGSRRGRKGCRSRRRSARWRDEEREQAGPALACAAASRAAIAALQSPGAALEGGGRRPARAEHLVPGGDVLHLRRCAAAAPSPGAPRSAPAAWAEGHIASSMPATSSIAARLRSTGMVAAAMASLASASDSRCASVSRELPVAARMRSPRCSAGRLQGTKGSGRPASVHDERKPRVEGAGGIPSHTTWLGANAATASTQAIRGSAEQRQLRPLGHADERQPVGGDARLREQPAAARLQPFQGHVFERGRERRELGLAAAEVAERRAPRSRAKRAAARSIAR